ncbi:MAG: 2-polyprenyl-3-methyl-6-methoxy-1,4-benzoquinone monooxygenase [Pseudomonadales bacterium]|jgi:ubiquinone biosynthesis monooxygenase Coq7|nr:2-polyprenyl-3-methyl-6-methoxy-1,4-benzoquinone monooxygenase [Gammaproteobacteria bacterium]MBK8307111.1 2-polyprenyl-3-methyl-6-methoxy-1,4-benzoquinone monooxygenase [Gammaproteobacteria bacterium]MBK9666496.1 2-polyprenyl-3-methyl-6-methoxy-1,4-benzoquinone monooxygenase [Gammaproteobacteria bacterium]MBP6052819.1 2-polyprenyl-3-methyl-6-methoxy-1,4-benzoquinone monooxygenase [Pseudomonadales bacterium]MBP6228447.1 2-polyprenyl-3-methyl-6-methoxy-1,4-benzoquinone monooxygenase [Pseudomo
MNRKLSLVDHLVIGLDRARRAATGEAPVPGRANPGAELDAAALDAEQRRHVAGLMRINHTGEVCAQALYQGQALTAKLDTVRNSMEQAAAEEIDHLAWCEQRVHELDSHTSVLNPLFYGMSFGLGALAGAIGDRWSLGFVAATEEQVCAHLRDHLEQLPVADQRSRAILEHMLADEARHATLALESGGEDFPPQLKELMRLASRLMTASTYRV